MMKIWRILILLGRFVCLLLLIESSGSNAFFAAFQFVSYRTGIDVSILRERHVLPYRWRQKAIRYPMQMMIRNIDLPEAVIFYGTNIVVPSFLPGKSDDGMRQLHGVHEDIVVDSRESKVRKGLQELLEECRSVKAAAIVLADNEGDDLVAVSTEENRNQSILLEKMFPKEILKLCHVSVQTAAPPNPTDLIAIVNSISIQPRPYGGSSTIGYSRAADPERLLDPKHCVVFTSTIEQTRVARALGMRVISINPDDNLADAVLMEYDDSDDENVSINIGIDDIATPGSFWLNPPHPRDDFGNRVEDPFETLLDLPASLHLNQNMQESDVDSDDDESNFRAMLNDIAPLY